MSGIPMRKPHKFKIEVKEEKKALLELLAFSPSEGLGRFAGELVQGGLEKELLVLVFCQMVDLCVLDEMENVVCIHSSTLTKLNKVPEKEFRNDFKGLLRALPDGRIIVSKGGCNNFFVSM